METNNQDQVKDLQYWKDFLAKKNGWNSYEQWKNHENLHEENLTLKAIDLMVNDRVQQAKDAAFTLDELKKAISMAQTYKPSPIPGNFSACGLYTEDEIINVLRPNGPHTAGEKGGEDTSQTT